MDESIVELFGPNAILPSQFFEMRRPAHRERRLMLAVLAEALAAFRRHAGASSRRGRRLFREAEEWIRSGDVEWPFAFENICQTLGIEAQLLRRRLDEWRATTRVG